MKKLRKSDPVIVISGKSKGAISTIESVDGDFVTLKDVNVVKKTLPLHVSNVAYYLESEKAPTKIAIEVSENGKKVRKAKKTGKIID